MKTSTVVSRLSGEHSKWFNWIPPQLLSPVNKILFVSFRKVSFVLILATYLITDV